MSVVTLTAQTITAVTLLVVWSAGSTDGVQFTNTGHEILLIRNEHATNAIAPTIVTGGVVAGLAVADIAQSIVAGATYVFGPFPKYLFDRAGTDIVSITCPAGATSLKFALVTVL